MAGWRYRVTVKPLFEAEAADEDAQARAAAPEVARRLADLARRVREPHVARGLTELAEHFEVVPEVDAPAYRFNQALADLYDFGDRTRVLIC